MGEGWVLLKVTRDIEVAVRQECVYRILDRHSPDYARHAPVARALHAALCLSPDRSQPGVITMMKDGSCWYSGDATFASPHAPLTFIPLPGDLFCTSPPWCRGVLVGQGRQAFVTDPRSMEAICG